MWLTPSLQGEVGDGTEPQQAPPGLCQGWRCWV